MLICLCILINISWNIFDDRSVFLDHTCSNYALFQLWCKAEVYLKYECFIHKQNVHFKQQMSSFPRPFVSHVCTLQDHRTLKIILVILEIIMKHEKVFVSRSKGIGDIIGQIMFVYDLQQNCCDKTHMYTESFKEILKWRVHSSKTQKNNAV